MVNINHVQIPLLPKDFIITSKKKMEENNASMCKKTETKIWQLSLQGDRGSQYRTQDSNRKMGEAISRGHSNCHRIKTT